MKTIKQIINIATTVNTEGDESYTISTINFGIHGSNKKFLKLYEGSRAKSSIYDVKLCNNYYKVLICSFRSIAGNIL